jgi:D-serine dehydratase
VNSLTGLQKAVPYIAKVFRETVANDIKQALASSSVQRILDAKTDIARTYQSDIRRRASRRLIASAKRVAARYAATR